MMATEISDKPGIEEQYQTASNTSNLAVEAERRGAGDVLIAAGWSASRVGMALLRLHSEWDSAAKPRRPGKELLAALAITIKAEDGQAKERAEAQCIPYIPRGSVTVRATDRAQAWYSSELRLLAQSLKSRVTVWQQLELHGKVSGIPSDIMAAALLHWLNPTCPVCDGHGLRKVPDQPALSARQCHKCRGTGKVDRPEGTARALNYFDDCVQKARGSLKQRLRA